MPAVQPCGVSVAPVAPSSPCAAAWLRPPGDLAQASLAARQRRRPGCRLGARQAAPAGRQACRHLVDAWPRLVDATACRWPRLAAWRPPDPWSAATGCRWPPGAGLQASGWVTEETATQPPWARALPPPGPKALPACPTASSAPGRRPAGAGGVPVRELHCRGGRHPLAPLSYMVSYISRLALPGGAHLAGGWRAAGGGGWGCEPGTKSSTKSMR